MAAKEKLSRKKTELQEVLVEAVLNGHINAVQKAGETLNKEHLKAEKETGPQVLDYVPSTLKDDTKQICPVKYRNHSPLMMALEEGKMEIAEKGKMEIAEKLLELQASAAFKNRDGLAALHIACNKGNLEAVKALLETAKRQKRFCQRKGKPDLDSDYEVIINAKERPQGWTALMYAVKGGHKEIVQELWQNPLLKCSIHNRKGQNVFHVAVRKGRLECLKLLHEPSETNQHLSAEEIKKACLATDTKDWNLLHQACTGDNVDMLDWLLAKMPELKEKINQPSKSGFTPLLVACEYRKLEIVKFLINREDLQVDINACCHSDDKGRGTSAIHLAVLHNAKELTKLLVEKTKCSLEETDKMGNNVLHVAYKNSSYPVINYITAICKDKGINLEVPNDDNKLPREAEEEIVIPPEIRKMGTDAVEVYKKALDEGKDKIPYCSMLILGKEQVGKTSLYRQLVGKEFWKDLDSTRGIDNTTVDTVDRRDIEIGEKKWLEKAEPELGEQFPEAVAGEMMDKLPQKAENKDKIKLVKEEELMKKIDLLTKEIESLLPKEVPPPHLVEVPQQWELRVWEPPRPILPQPVSRDIVSILTQPKERQVPASPPAQRKVEPKPEKKATPDPPPPAAVLPKPVPRAPQKPNPPPNPTPPSTPPKPVPRKRVPASTPMVTPKQGSNIAGLLKKRKKKKESPLVLNTLDFAGQKEYRPMHHCFISKRGLYLVVFKIPDVLEHIEKGCTEPCPALVEVRYWVHSIHAHIYTKTSDDKTRRILLVGTHRGETKECDLSKVNKLIKDDVLYERRYQNHIYRTGSNCHPYFVPVENSIDIKCCGKEYLEKSGTLFVQEKVKSMSRQLPFLKEEYPIKWLKFEERLKKQQEERQPPIVTVQEAVELAKKSRIETEKEQKLAIKFFHEAGKIICLSELPTLFLEEEEKEKLEDLVVLYPQWLINVMKKIMELNTAHNPEGLANSKVDELVDKGIAEHCVLEVCWKDFLSSSITMEHLCLIMQAYCLIYPVQPSTCDNSQGAQYKYMIPCMLPEKLDENVKDKCGIVFYFQFHYFLPDEIYHKLICLASEKSIPRRNRSNSYSQTKCIYDYWMGTAWMIEFEKDMKRLKFTVINKAEDHPSKYIESIHKDYLRPICEDMEGLSYYGGPQRTCEECGEASVLDYVTSEKVESNRSPELHCGHEPKESVDKILMASYVRYKSKDSDVQLDLKKVLLVVHEVAAKWKSLGVALEIKDSALDTIQVNHSVAEDRLMETINLWLRGEGGEKSWKFLCDALKYPLVNRPDLAKKLPTNS